MNDEHSLNGSAGTPRDPHLDVLDGEFRSHKRTGEQRETEHHESLSRRRAGYDADITRKSNRAGMVEDIEVDRVQSLRHLRCELDKDVLAAHDVAARSFANLGHEYVPGKSKVSDLYEVDPLCDAEASDRAGIPASCSWSDVLLKVLKYAGMIGCLLLGMIGMGALVLHIQPRSLFHSPFAVVAAGLAFILVGGAYLIVSPGSRRLGALTILRPNDPATKWSRLTVAITVAVATIIVALVDAKALVAINSARAMVNPESVPPFAVTFLVASALSAAYVCGTACLSYSDGYGFEGCKRLEGEQTKHAQAHRRDRRNSLEVSQAIEALNGVCLVEARRTDLNDEILEAERELKQTLTSIFADTEAPPEMPVEHRRDIRYHDQEARFAGQKLTAYETLRARFAGLKGKKMDGGAA